MAVTITLPTPLDIATNNTWGTTLNTAITAVNNAVLFARKTVDETVTSSTTHQDDNELFLTVAANAIYIVECFCVYDADSAADINVRFSVPAGATFGWTPQDMAVGAASVIEGHDHGFNIATGTSTSGAFGAGTKVTVIQKGMLITAGTAGTIQFRWAQNTSSVVATTVFAGSFIYALRVA